MNQTHPSPLQRFLQQVLTICLQQNQPLLTLFPRRISTTCNNFGSNANFSSLHQWNSQHQWQSEPYGNSVPCRISCRAVAFFGFPCRAVAVQFAFDFSVILPLPRQNAKPTRHGKRPQNLAKCSIKPKLKIDKNIFSAPFLGFFDCLLRFNGAHKKWVAI